MLLVKTYIGPSNIHGIGLFAAEQIKKGTPTWKFADGFDLKFTEYDLLKLSEPARKQYLNYCYIDREEPDVYVLCFDDARFMNHSENPTTINGSLPDGTYVDIAARDINIGEELTYNYIKEDLDYDRKFNSTAL